MPLDCSLPAKELEEVYGNLPPDADETETRDAILGLVEEAINLLRLVANLLITRARLIRVDFTSYPFKETGDFLSTTDLLSLATPPQEAETWSLPFQSYMIDELRSLSPVFGVPEHRPDLVILAAVRLNELFIDHLRENRRLGLASAIRGPVQAVDQRRMLQPLTRGDGLLRRYVGPIEQFDMTVYDDADRPVRARFEVRYDMLPLLDVIDTMASAGSHEFGWDQLIAPPYDLICDLPVHKPGENALKVLARVPRHSFPISVIKQVLQSRNSDELSPSATTILADSINTMQKFEALRKHNLRLIRLNTAKEPHPIVDEDWFELIDFRLGELVLLLSGPGVAIDSYIQEEKEGYTDHYTYEDYLYQYENKLEDLTIDYENTPLRLSPHLVEALKSYASFFNVPSDRLDLLVTCVTLLNQRLRSAILDERRACRNPHVTVCMRHCLRGLAEDIAVYEADCGAALGLLDVALVVDAPETVQSDEAWPESSQNRPNHPVPLYREWRQRSH